MTGQSRSWHPDVPSLQEVYHADFAHAYPLHAHDDWTVLLVDAGAVSYDLDRSAHLATPDVLTVLPPGVPHDGRSAVAGTGYRKRVLYFGGGWLPSTAADVAARRPTIRGAAVTSARRVHAALRAPGDLMAAEHWSLELRRQLRQHVGDGETAGRDAPLARRLRSLLEERDQEPLTIAGLSAELGVHPSHVTRAFTQTYGMPPHRYLVTRRIDRARRLLLDGVAPAEAAALAGFHDQAHLTRHFRRVLGTTPAAFAGRIRR